MEGRETGWTHRLFDHGESGLRSVAISLATAKNSDDDMICSAYALNT